MAENRRGDFFDSHCMLNILLLLIINR